MTAACVEDTLKRDLLGAVCCLKRPKNPSTGNNYLFLLCMQSGKFRLWAEWD